MSSPSVTIRTLDLSQFVPNFPGVSVGMVLPAVKGPLEATLVTSQAQFLSQYTPNNKVEVGYDNGYFSALAYLQSGDKLWVKRAHNSALYGGIILKNSSSAQSNASITGMADPNAYSFDGTAMVAAAAVFTITCEADVTGSLNNKFFFISSLTKNYYVWFNVNSLGVNPNFANMTGVQVSLATNATATQVAVAISAALNALSDFTSPEPVTAVSVITLASNGIPIKYPDLGTTGWVTSIAVTAPGVKVDTTNDYCLIYALNPGKWNNDLSIKIDTYLTNPSKVQLEGAFIIYVYYKGVLQEEFLCSKSQDLKDENGNNIYIESILAASSYIRALDSTGVTGYPKAITSALSITLGSDGSAVTDGEMISAVEAFSNPDDISITLLIDSGWSTPAYGKKITQICESRKDCFGILTTPYANEASSSYINSLLDYRKYDLNINNSYSALFSTSVKIYDQYNSRSLYTSADGYIAGVISNTAVNQEPWFAPAGFNRGQLLVLDVRRRFTKGEMDVLYDNGINPIRFVAGRGIVVWGQKTLLAEPSALNRINVRMLLIVIQPAIAYTLESFIFEMNDAQTRNQITTIITDYMNDVQARRGVYDFLCVCDETNNTSAVIDRNEMLVDLYIKPTKVAEFIKFTTIITSTGASFQ